MQKNKRTTLQDIAEHTGFSVATVSRVLSGSPRISDDTRRKIIRCADMYNYRMKCKNVAMLTLGYGLYFSNMLTALQKEFLNREINQLIRSIPTYDSINKDIF